MFQIKAMLNSDAKPAAGKVPTAAEQEIYNIKHNTTLTRLWVQLVYSQSFPQIKTPMFKFHCFSEERKAILVSWNLRTSLKPIHVKDVLARESPEEELNFAFPDNLEIWFYGPFYTYTIVSYTRFANKCHLYRLLYWEMLDKINQIKLWPTGD